MNQSLNMKRRLAAWFCAGSVVALVATAATAYAQQAAPPPEEESSVATPGTLHTGPKVATPLGLDGKPDLSGLWRPVRTPGLPGGNMGKDEPNFILPFNAVGLRALVYSQNHTVDPESICILGGIPRHNASGLAFEILHTPERFGTFYNYNTHRVATIGKNPTFPAHLTPTYFGTGLAHWEGDVLVIETRGLRDSSRDRIWLDENGNPTSNQTVVIERWSRPDYHTLNLAMTITDPKYYTRPISFNRTWTRSDRGQGQGEYPCNETNNAAEHIGPGAGVIGPDGNRGFGYTNAVLPDAPPGPEAYADVLDKN